MRKIGIIGMGNVGSALAHTLISQGVADSYVFIDTNESKSQADALDFEDAMANMKSFASITVNDYAALADADIVVSALGNIALQHNAGEDRFAEFPFTKQEVKSVSKRLVEVGFNGILLVITNPCDAVCALYQHYTGLPKARVFGTGTLLDTARMKRALGKAFSVHPKSVSGYNLGEHGNSQFVAWSQVTLKGQSIMALTTEEEREALNLAALKGGHTVFYGKGYTSFGIAASATRLIEAIFTDSKEVLPVSSYQESYQTYLGYPCVIGREGIVETPSLQLTAVEYQKLSASARLIASKVQSALSEA
ncbi:L-lactate dehydrogenase [Streptococcus saliviloxodontae]|uniref:L-lactate dehydrogenase n=1 Tax=Streptococcus saliviloxodontae TaxID=1349416 RepID=A0ABS2PMV8_9STRE|nr:L-lactate dehydrogenase [Streptococcus saliviloxodontae]MBM7636770.1 L-lactate dehydrogenase [Streptococcus saliviloxodontae]